VGKVVVGERLVMAGMLMLSGVDGDCGKMNIKKAVLVGAVP
jgi:hypothetical protein